MSIFESSPSILNSSYLNLPPLFFEKITPQAFPKAEMIYFNSELGSQFGLDFSPEVSEIFGLKKWPSHIQPLAQAYAGHQFGHFNILGDGRALLLGEVKDSSGFLHEIHVKGAGRTSFSRGGDGLASLNPMLRELLVSEFLSHVGVPTTRALAVLSTGDFVQREGLEAGGLLVRTSRSHIRAGTFQWAAARGEPQDVLALSKHFAERVGLNFFSLEEILQYGVRSQARLVANWMALGFVHGVMNTDNLSCIGETLDLGPCAFVDTYNPKSVFSSIDRRGRYAFDQQPQIALWNLCRWAEALLAAEPEKKSQAEKILESFSDQFTTEWTGLMAKKMGLKDDNRPLRDELLRLMEQEGYDYTLTFRSLSCESLAPGFWGNPEPFLAWRSKWEQNLIAEGKNPLEVREDLKKVNPAVVPRNPWLQQAFDEQTHGRDSAWRELLDLFQNPFEDPSKKWQMPVATRSDFKTYCGT